MKKILSILWLFSKHNRDLLSKALGHQKLLPLNVLGLSLFRILCALMLRTSSGLERGQTLGNGIESDNKLIANHPCGLIGFWQRHLCATLYLFLQSLLRHQVQKSAE